MMRQQWLVFLPMTLATAGLAACASMLGSETVKMRPVDTLSVQSSNPRDPLYESAVAAINERDYGRALDYLQAAKAKDPRNVKTLNALGVVYDKLGRFDLSARYYAQARAIEPESKIVAENMGYSRVLQQLVNPNAPVAVATIDLPAGAAAQAAPSSSGAMPVPDANKPATVLATASSAVTPAPRLVAKPNFVTLPAVSPVVVELSSLAVTDSSADFELPRPEERRVVGRSDILASAERFPLTTTAIPSLPAAAMEIPAAPVAAPAILDAPLPRPQARQVAVRSVVVASADRLPLTAATIPSLPAAAMDIPAAPVAAAAVPDAPLPRPQARQVIVRSIVVASADRLPLTAAIPPLPAPAMEIPAAPVAAPAIPDASLPRPQARQVIVRSIVVASADRLPLTAAAIPSLPAPAMDTPAAPVATPAIPDAPLPRPQARQIIIRSTVLASADRLPLTAAAMSSALVLPAMDVPAPAVAAPAVPAALMGTPPAQRKVAAPVLPAAAIPAPKAQIFPALKMTGAPAAKPRPVMLASVPAVPPLPLKNAASLTAIAKTVESLPEKKTVVTPSATKAVVVASASLPAKMAAPIKPVPAKQAPVKIVAPKWESTKPAPARTAMVQTAPAANHQAAPRKFLTIGQPVRLMNASGKQGGTATVLRRLGTLGWTMRPSDARAQPVTVLYYSAQNVAAAKALQRTLPFPVRLMVDKASGMRLVVGRDYLFWRPRNARLAALWQRGAFVAVALKPSIRGGR